MQYTPKKLHYKPFTLNIIIYLCPQNKISNNPIHVGLYVGFGGINQMHLLIINYLSSKYYQNTYHYSQTIVQLKSFFRSTIVERKLEC